jgi:hypothetical protein
LGQGKRVSARVVADLDPGALIDECCREVSFPEVAGLVDVPVGRYGESNHPILATNQRSGLQ